MRSGAATSERAGGVWGGTATEVVDALILRAVATGASDVHLDPQEDAVRVRVRRDGVLEDVEPIALDAWTRVVGRLKALSGLLAYRSDVPQEGSVPPSSACGHECRVATFPVLRGERVALRFEVPEARLGTLADLGLSPAVEASLRAAWREAEGVVLLTGPSGSGKTTTLYAGVREVLAESPPRTVLTIEDPIERRIEGASQTPVNAAAGLTYARALRSLMRQDPDVILVGEIRDSETASIVFEAGLTGHLVAATLHAGTCAQVFVRLSEMGIEPFVLTTALRGVLAQRLVRRRGVDGAWAGRVPLAEWAPVDASVRRVVLARGDADAFEASRRAAGRPCLADDAERLVGAGVTTHEEIDRVLGTV
jgi:type II secretory ATPase GspE/PulE/Tfp pilus assembly ATPase PilB-like protein